MNAQLLILPRLLACREAAQSKPNAGLTLVASRGFSSGSSAVSASAPALRLVTPAPAVPAVPAFPEETFAPGIRKGPQRITLLQAAAAPAVETANPLEAPAAVHAAEAALNSIQLRRQRATLDGVGLEFYRKYTEAMLRRYVRLSMEAGRVPSMLGRELFRGHVSTHKVQSFEDVSNFVHDISRCLLLLDPGQQHLVRRIALEEYTQEETAGMLGMSLRTVIRRYREAIDRLTRTLLERRMLEPLKATDLTNL